jgi:hypothetical protein
VSRLRSCETPAPHCAAVFVRPGTIACIPVFETQMDFVRRTPMATSRKRLRIVGLAGTLRAMRQWLKIGPRTPVRFQTVRRPRQAAVVRLEPAPAGPRLRKPAT